MEKPAIVEPVNVMEHIIVESVNVIKHVIVAKKKQTRSTKFQNHISSFTSSPTKENKKK